MIAVENPGLISIEDYIAGEEAGGVKHEYIGGVIHAMSGGTNQHGSIAFNVLLELGSRLRGKPCRPFTSDTKVRIQFHDHTRFYYPDAMVVCLQNPPTDHFQDHPAVVVEILSPSTRRTDLGEKKEAYLQLSSLKVLILAESTRPDAIVYRRKTEGGFAMERWIGTDSVIPLPEIGAELPLEELYNGVDFDASP